MASTAQALRALWASYSAVGADGAPRCMDADAFADLCEACPGLLTDVFTLDDALDAYDAAVAPDDTAAADASPPSQGLSFSQFVAALEGVAEDRYPGVGAWRGGARLRASNARARVVRSYSCARRSHAHRVRERGVALRVRGVARPRCG